MDTIEMLKSHIRDVPDFPKEGILFRDITPLLGNPDALHAAIDLMAEPFLDKGITHIAAAEARGFIFGTAIANRLHAGFVPIRKKGKLPYETEEVTYDLEYGTDTLQVHKDACKGGHVLLVDDLLATGGTMAASCELIEKVGGTVAGTTFLIELKFLAGRDRLPGYDIHTIIEY